MVDTPYKFCSEFSFKSKSNIDALKEFHYCLNQTIEFINFVRYQNIPVNELRNMLRAMGLSHSTVIWKLFNIFDTADGIVLNEINDNQFKLLIYSDKEIPAIWDSVLQSFGLDKDISYDCVIKDFEQSWYHNRFKYLLIL